MNIRSAFVWVTLFGSVNAMAALEPQKVYLAETRKSHVYVQDALISGGDRAIDSVTVKSIRRARNRGYERVVLDLEGTRSGEPAAIPRAPYFQVASEPQHNRVVVTIWGDPQLRFDAPKVKRLFSRSALVRDVDLLPKLEKESWTFSLNLKQDASIEVFELKNPVRVILDLKPARTPAQVQ